MTPIHSGQHYPDLLLLRQHEELLIASAITPEVAVKRGYRSVDTKAALARLGFSKFQQHVPALVSPVWSAVTGQVAFWQARPDMPRLNGDGKTIKYETPANIRMAVDVHPMVRSKLGDPSIRLWITEGIRKGDALVSAGECAVALLGVWNWRGRNEHGGKAVLADWDMIALNNRAVYLAYDSDAMVKREVHAALQRLAAFLKGRSAHIHFVYLPTGEAGAKVGVDDYLAAGHTVAELVTLAADELREPISSPVPVLAESLEDVTAFLRRYVTFASPHQALVAALWTAHTHVCDCFDVSPFLHVSSPEKRSGKTRFLEVEELLVRAPWRVISPSEAVLFRKIDAEHPTLLLDEVDTIFGRGRDDAHEPLRALLNAGNRRGVTVPRCVGDGTEIRLVEFSVFTPRILAGIGTLPDTVADRSIPIRLQRRAAHERVEPFRLREAADEAAEIRAALERWAIAEGDKLESARPEIPAALNDRAAEMWEPLLAIADLAGGEWPRRARAAAVALQGVAAAQDETVGVTLLGALREIFDEAQVDHLTTAELITALSHREDVALPEWWARAARDDLRSAGRWLARHLRGFEIEPEKWRSGTDTIRGYRRGAFAAAWARYVPTDAQRTPSQRSSVHATHATNLAKQGLEPDPLHATDPPCGVCENRPKATQDNDCGVRGMYGASGMDATAPVVASVLSGPILGKEPHPLSAKAVSESGDTSPTVPLLPAADDRPALVDWILARAAALGFPRFYFTTHRWIGANKAARSTFTRIKPVEDLVLVRDALMQISQSKGRGDRSTGGAAGANLATIEVAKL